jgi:hypothetical protein
LHAGNEESQYESDLGPGDNAAGCLPMSDAKIDCQGGGKKSEKIEKEKQRWNYSHHQGNGIVTYPVIFKTFYFLFVFSVIEA